jgi:hypothetical protein
VLNAESNRETAAQIKARQTQAARYLAKHPLTSAVRFDAFVESHVPAPGGPTLAAIVEKHLPDCIADHVPSQPMRDGTFQCPVCAERKRKHAEKVARLRAKRHAN